MPGSRLQDCDCTDVENPVVFSDGLHLESGGFHRFGKAKACDVLLRRAREMLFQAIGRLRLVHRFSWMAVQGNVIAQGALDVLWEIGEMLIGFKHGNHPLS